MRLRSGLEDEFLCMEEKFDFFVQYDMVYVNEVSFYEELSDIGKATERAVGEALSESGEFLGCLTDVNGIFCNSRAACLQLAAEILVFVGRGMDVNHMETWELKELRGTLKSKFARLKGSWENLLWYAIEYDESAVFHEISELVWVTEEATNEAKFYDPYWIAALTAGAAMQIALLSQENHFQRKLE